MNMSIDNDRKVLTAADKALQRRIALESRIARAAIDGILSAGFCIALNNGEEQYRRDDNAKRLHSRMMQTDEDSLIVYRQDKRVGFVYFVYGNGGWDVINDYTVNLEACLAKAEAIADKAEAIL